MDGLLRLVSGYNPRNDKFSRFPDDFITLDTYSIGFAHWWSKYAPELLLKLPEHLITYAWGTTKEEFKEKIEAIPWNKGKNRMRDYDFLPWLCAGWYEIGLHPIVVKAEADFWKNECAVPSMKACKDLGVTDKATFACTARIANSRGASNAKKWLKRSLKKYTAEADVREYLMNDLYDHGERLVRIEKMQEFSGKLETYKDALRWYPLISLKPVRIDGSTPNWYSPPINGEPSFSDRTVSGNHIDLCMQ